MRTLTILAVLTALLVAPAAGRADEDVRSISFTFEETDVREVIRTITAFAEVSVIVSPKVQGKISVSLKDVPWNTALRQIVESIGCRLVEEEHGILRVVRAEELREEYPRRARPKKGRRVADARSKYADARKRLEDARRRLEALQELGEDASEERIEKTRDEIKELEAWQASLRKQVAEIERRSARAREAAAKGAEVAAARKRADEARADLLRSKSFADAKAADAKRHKRLTDVENARGAALGALRQAEHLERAAESLKAAGMMNDAERALHKARDLRAAAKPRYGRSGGNLVESVNALRRDVRALREQVAELTGLVRRLIERRPPSARRPR